MFVRYQEKINVGEIQLKINLVYYALIIKSAILLTYLNSCTVKTFIEFIKVEIVILLKLYRTQKSHKLIRALKTNSEIVIYSLKGIPFSYFNKI